MQRGGKVFPTALHEKQGKASYRRGASREQPASFDPEESIYEQSLDGTDNYCCLFA